MFVPSCLIFLYFLKLTFCVIESITTLSDKNFAIKKQNEDKTLLKNKAISGIRTISTRDMNLINNSDAGFLRSNFLKLANIYGIVKCDAFRSWSYLKELINENLILPYMIEAILDSINATVTLDFPQFLKVMKSLDDQRFDNPLMQNETLTDTELLDLEGLTTDDEGEFANTDDIDIDPLDLVELNDDDFKEFEKASPSEIPSSAPI